MRLFQLPHEGQRSIREHMHEGGWEEAAFLWLCLEDALHPVVVLRLLGEYDDDVTLLEGQFVLVVGLAVVQGSAPLVPLVLRTLKEKKILNFAIYIGSKTQTCETETAL